VLFDNQELSRLSERELTRQRLRFGFVFQGAALFDSLTVFDNIAFPLREHTRKSDEEIRNDVRQRLQEVGLPASVETKKPAELSGGMKKRVGLARAIILGPEIVLYDEPTTGLDPLMSDTIDSLILQTRERHGVTSVIVTHDLKTVRKVAHRVIMIEPVSRLEPGQSQIIFDGPLAELEHCQDPRVRKFVGATSPDRKGGESKTGSGPGTESGEGGSTSPDHKGGESGAGAGTESGESP
jgi:phospholipid/cholesterol/gamma-HCH transport system ATP-binding protein